MFIHKNLDVICIFAKPHPPALSGQTPEHRWHLSAPSAISHYQSDPHGPRETSPLEAGDLLVPCAPPAIYVCMYVCMHACMYVYIYTYVCIYIYTYVCYVMLCYVMLC